MEGLRVGWLLVGNERVASARIQGLAMHREMRQRGIRSEILSMPTSFDTRLRWKAPRRWFEALGHRRDVLIFQKVESSRAVRYARLARRVGTRIIFLQADARDSAMYKVAHRVVVSSGELARLLEPLTPGKITVIEDAIEHPRDVITEPGDRREGLKVLWIGARANFASLDRIRPILNRREFRDLRLVTVSDHPEADVVWSTEAARREIMTADLAVIPCLDTPIARAKSNNRLTMLMGAGLSVIASPIPAYRTVVEHGRSGFLAESPEDWAAALSALRDPETRRAMGEAARLSAWSRFAPEVVAGRWESLLEALAGRPGLALAAERQRVLSEP